MKWSWGGKKETESNKDRYKSWTHDGAKPQDLSRYDCYSILGLTYNASLEEIKRAYRKLALQYHPDRNSSPEATAIFTVIQMAYDTLSDERRRKQYDSTIPALASTKQSKVKVILEGAYTVDDLLDDRASISVEDSDDAIVFENTISIPTIWIHKGGEHRQYGLYSDVAFDRLLRALYGLIDPHEKLNDVMVYGKPKLRAHFDARFWNRGQTNISLYCYSSMSFTIINGIPFLYLHGAKYHNAHHEITVEFYIKMVDAISSLVRKELEGTVEPPAETEAKTLFQPIKHISELKLPPFEICELFVTLSRTKSAQEAIDMLCKVYGVPSMTAVFQHRFPVKDMVCEDALAVYYSDGMIAYFRPEGTTMKTILHEFYHHLVNCYGVRLDYEVIPDANTGYFTRNAREEFAANSYAETFLRRAMT